MAGRPHLSLEDLVAKYPKDGLKIITRRLEDGAVIRALKCSVCPNSPEWSRRTNPPDPAPNAAAPPPDRIPKYVADHIGSKAHKERLSGDAMSKKIPAAFATQRAVDVEALTRQEHFQLGFVLSLARSGLSSEFISSPMVQFLSQYCVELNRLQSKTTLVDKIRPQVYSVAKSDVAALLKDRLVFLVVDESPNKVNQPIVNVLAEFFNPLFPKGPSYALLESRLITEGRCDAERVKSIIDETLASFNIPANRFLGIASDSASYMKLVGETYLQSEQYAHLVLIRDPSHLLHDIVKSIIEDSASDLYDFLQNMIEACRLRDLAALAGRKIPRSGHTRWGSVERSVKVLNEFWDVFMGLLRADVPPRACLIAARQALDRITEDVLWAKFTMFHIILVRFTKSIRYFESKKPRAPFVVRKLNEFQALLAQPVVVPPEHAVDVPAAVVVWAQTLSQSAFTKVNTILRNNQHGTALFLWTALSILDPTQKGAFSTNPNSPHVAYLRRLIAAVVPEHDRLLADTHFSNYLEENFAFPAGHRMKSQALWTFWEAKSATQSALSLAALQLISVPTGSGEVERSFSEEKSVGLNPLKTKMTPESVKESHFLQYNRREGVLAGQALFLKRPRED